MSGIKVLTPKKIKGRPTIDLAGARFGRLVVVSVHKKTPHGTKWLCNCDCGNNKIVAVSHLTSGDIKSCGCFNSEESRKRKVTHGAAPMRRNGGPTKTYRVWLSMKSRCSRKIQRCYKEITVCDRWQNSFSNFLLDMGECPSEQHSLDRFPNQKGNYEPGNCRWATAKEQNRNRSNNRWIEHNGERMILQDWADHVGVSVKNLWYYLKHHTFDEAIKFYSHAKV